MNTAAWAAEWEWECSSILDFELWIFFDFHQAKGFIFEQNEAFLLLINRVFV